MPCGLFGKLPSKRDFVAVSVPRSFLDVWEVWLQGGLSASRVALGDAWQEVFLRAPIWRFWLGAGVCGGTAAGAFMPSVDGVGRYYPLTVVAVAEKPYAIPPPELDPQEAWFGKAEDVLLSALAPDASFEGVIESLQALPGPLDLVASGPPEGMVRLPDGTILSAAAPSSLPARLSAIRIEDHARAYATMSVWWTIGGEDFPPLALVGQRMPDPHLFTTLLTGEPEGAAR
jgi:type VI secretion system protein ImpM